MKKIVSIIVASILVGSGLLQSQVQAAAPIGIYINGVKLSTDQAPIVVSSRALLPLRAIFEALDARVDWNANTKVVTANKDGNTIVLKLGAKTATINNSTVALDVPVQSINGRTMIPVRFVSEALGEQVDWNSSTQRVTITTSTEVNPVSYVNVRVNGQLGNGSDLDVSFPKAAKENGVGEYRIYVVKSANASSFNVTTALSNYNYTSVPVQGRDVSLTLSYQAKDTNGELVKANQSYNVYVLTVGKDSTSSILSNASQTVTLSAGSPVASVTSVTPTDVSDYGDGRDLKVTFTKPQTDSNIANYRVMVVKTTNASKFDVNTANGVSSSNYTTVNKSGTTLTTTLTSSSRDTAGELIRNGVSYTVFVLSVSNNSNTYSNKLSSGSSSIILNNNPVVAPVITRVDDVSDYGDGRDLSVSFNKVSDESRIGSYRIFVVKENNAYNFDLTKANAVSSNNYMNVSKTGYNINQVLSSSARDVDGSTIRNGVSYRVFIMSVGTGSYAGSNVLSSYSSAIVLSANSNVSAVTNLNVNDVSDYNDGRDLRVSFNKPYDESNISHYRVMVVKSGNANSFSLSSANAVSSSNYTYISKTGYNISQSLGTGARDVDGALIKNGVSYRVFVLSVGTGSNSGYNTLSDYSSSITLSGNNYVSAVTNLGVKDVSDFNNGSDLQVSFNRINDENTISHYRVMVVKSGNANNFTLSSANAVSSSNYTYVSKTGYDIRQILASTARDVDGAAIKNDVSYRMFVLSVGTGNNAGSNALSDYSSSITLSGNYNVSAVTNLGVSDVSDNNNGSDLQVSFNRINDEDTISEYRVMIVKTKNASNFTPAMANQLPNSNYTPVRKTGGNISQILGTEARDVDGAKIKNGESYRAYVLSVGTGSYIGNNALSSGSADIILSSNSAVAAVSNLNAAVKGNNGDGRDIEVSFSKVVDETSVASYRIIVVPSDQADSFSLDDANRVLDYTEVRKLGRDIKQSLTNTIDFKGRALKTGVDYQVLVLTVADGKGSSVNALSVPSGKVILKVPTIELAPVTNVTADLDKNTSKWNVKFDTTNKEKGVSEYVVFIVPSTPAFTLTDSLKSTAYKVLNKENNVTVDLEASDITGVPLKVGPDGYYVFILSKADGKSATVNVLSAASSKITF
ncbi:hypothetical protein PMSD_18630 [Paenibacillus macquariensis subsp. defensor]|nr:hypothetical protein PMSD_18630 [Paenibacillus macquariensis subsp. defensor]